MNYLIIWVSFFLASGSLTHCAEDDSFALPYRYGEDDDDASEMKENEKLSNEGSDSDSDLEPNARILKWRLFDDMPDDEYLHWYNTHNDWAPGYKRPYRECPEKNNGCKFCLKKENLRLAEEASVEKFRTELASKKRLEQHGAAASAAAIPHALPQLSIHSGPHIKRTLRHSEKTMSVRKLLVIGGAVATIAGLVLYFETPKIRS